MRIAIMQPYFYPYAGYFRLLYAADMFVALDCVQFPRRGWVHRNQLHDQTGQKSWITLPLLKTDRDSTKISDLKFNVNAKELFTEQFNRFPCLNKLENKHANIYKAITDFEVDPVTYIIRNIEIVNAWLGFNRHIVRSSTLSIPSNLRGQNRIIAIAKELGGKEYINSPGGKSLYSNDVFYKEGITLKFLSDYSGPFDSMLERILLQDSASIRTEISLNTILLDT